MKKRVLIIDDDKELCEEISDILKSEGFKTDTANDGNTGFNLAAGNDYKIIILDLKMPGISGFEVLKKIKEMNKEIKVIVISARTEINVTDDDIIRLAAENNSLNAADYILKKPFKVKELLAILPELI